MNPGGLILMVENAEGSDPELFEEMIRAGGGEPLTVHPGTDIHAGRGVRRESAPAGYPPPGRADADR